MGPALRDEQLEPHRAQALLAGRALGEAHELAPDPDPAVGRVGGQHPELAGVRVDPPDAHGADDLVAQTGHRQLARPG